MHHDLAIVPRIARTLVRSLFLNRFGDCAVVGRSSHAGQLMSDSSPAANSGVMGVLQWWQYLARSLIRAKHPGHTVCMSISCSVKSLSQNRQDFSFAERGAPQEEQRTDRRIVPDGLRHLHWCTAVAVEHGPNLPTGSIILPAAIRTGNEQTHGMQGGGATFNFTR